MITLYGTARLRASRSLLALEELGLRYQHVPLQPWPGTADREALGRINPNCRIPVLDDAGLIVWESMAINLYLGDKYGGPLWPGSALAKSVYLLAGRFALADLKVASTLCEPYESGVADWAGVDPLAMRAQGAGRLAWPVHRESRVPTRLQDA